MVTDSDSYSLSILYPILYPIVYLILYPILFSILYLTLFLSPECSIGSQADGSGQFHREPRSQDVELFVLLDEHQWAARR